MIIAGCCRLLARLGFGGILLIGLLILNLTLNPEGFAPNSWGIQIGMAAPLIAAAMAETPAVLSGRGGLDISVGPAMGFVNAVVVVFFIGVWDFTNPIAIFMIAIFLGASIGVCNGLLSSVIRIQPIVATLGTYLILSGMTTTLVPSPTGTVPEWMHALSGTWSILPLVFIGLCWLILLNTPYYAALMAIGSDDRAAFTSGINVTLARLLAYVLSGVFTGVAGLSLTALIGSADPNIGGVYTLTALSAVALGGISLAGGRGTMTGAVIGALDIFLLQTALTYFNVSSYVIQIVYGTILVLAVVATAAPYRLSTSRITR